MKKLLTNNLGLKLTSLFIAAFLWVIIINVDDPVTKRAFENIEVTIINDDAIRANGKTYDIPEEARTVTVHVRGKTSVFRSLKSSDLEVTADLSQLTADYPSVNLSVTVKRYESQIEEIWVEPGTMPVNLDDVGSETFPVQINQIGKPVDGYTVGEMKAEPESVAVTGPSAVLAKISRVSADVNVNGLSDDVVLVAGLKAYDEDGNELSTVTVNQGEQVSISITMFMNKNVTLEYDDEGVPAPGYELKSVEFRPATVTVAGRAEDLKSFDSIIVSETRSEIGINGAMEGNEKLITNLADYLPDGVRLVDQEESILIRFTIDEYGAEPVRIPVDSINVSNKADGITFSYADTQDLVVTVRGESEVISQLTAADLSPSIDLRDYREEGEYEILVHFNLPTDCTLDGDVMVKVILKKEAADTGNSVENAGE